MGEMGPPKKPRLDKNELRLLEFAAWILQEWYEYDCSDLDGGNIQNYLDQHLLKRVTQEKPCHKTACKCEEYDVFFPTECSQYVDGLLNTLQQYGYDRGKEGRERGV
jgi:hypothetical protein